MTQEEFIHKLLAITAFNHTDDLWWRFKEGASKPKSPEDHLEFFVNCNDLFFWGSADLEQITPENIHLLEQAYKDSKYHGAALFASRVRRQRVQGAWFAKGYFDAEEIEVFAAAGPEREVGLGNPYPWMTKEAYEASLPKVEK